MKFSNGLRIALLTVAVLLIGLQIQRHRRQSRDLADVQTQLQSRIREIEMSSTNLAALEQRIGKVVEAERRAGNQTLVSLMRERAEVTMSDSGSESRSSGYASALANVLDNPELQAVEREALRNQIRAGMGGFFRLAHVTPENIDRYIDLQVEMEIRKANRNSALLRGRMTLADALRERDRDKVEEEKGRQQYFGPEANAFFESIADEMRNDEAKRTLGDIKENMTSNALNQDQCDRLQGLIKTEIATLKMDETDLFRTPDDWAQFIGDHQQSVLNQAAAFLSPAQQEALKNLAAVDLEIKKQDMIAKRKAMGIK